MRNIRLNVSPTLTFQKAELTEHIHPGMKDLVGDNAGKSLQTEAQCIMLCYTLQYIWMYKAKFFSVHVCEKYFDTNG